MDIFNSYINLPEGKCWILSDGSMQNHRGTGISWDEITLACSRHAQKTTEIQMRWIFPLGMIYTWWSFLFKCCQYLTGR